MERNEPSPRAAESDRLVGALINGKYRVLAPVGAGGMGMIYRADQLPLGRPVALKILRAQARGRDAGPELVQLKKRFFREASILSKLQHPNIVTIYDYGAVDEAGDQYFMAMEFLSGKTLAERAEEGPMAFATAVRVASQIARGLGEAHAQGIVHRDLKPSNVMLVTGREGDERVKVIDFGIVKLIGQEQPEEDLTIEGTIVGSPKYMAPEQFLPSNNLDCRADIWALGVVLYRLLTGKPPFEGETTGWLVHDVLNATVPRVGQARPETPAALDDIVARCLERSQALRFRTMGEVADALDALGFGAVSAGAAGVGGEASDGAGVPFVRTVRPPAPLEVTTGPESMVAISTRNGTQSGKRASKVFAGIGVVALIVFAVAVGRFSANATGGERKVTAGEGVVAESVLGTPTATATVAATIILARPDAGIAGAATASGVEPAPAKAAGGARSSGRGKPGRAKGTSGDDIPAVR